jgi:hypothetical protein
MNFFKQYEDDEKINNLFQYMARTKIKDKILQEDFIYNKQYMFKNIFNIELCNKIVEECCDINEWISDYNSIHYQYKFMDIEKLSTDTIKNVLTIIYNKLPEISRLYELEKTQLEITEIVIIKNDEYNEYFSTNTHDVDFLKFNILLNHHNDFEGGDFNLYNRNKLTLNKITGNTYIFDVRIEHEITPILEGTRYSLLWFLQSEHVKIEINKLI